MVYMGPARKIRSIHFRRILNSHVEFAVEFIVELEDHTIGIGSSPKGETLSIHEKGDAQEIPRRIVEVMTADGLLNRPLDQAEFDAFLQPRAKTLGRGNCFALSLAFFDANERSCARLEENYKMRIKPNFPHICLNVLNGGRHAYTNPVLSDFPEFLLVPRNGLLEDVINEHNQLQKRIRGKLAKSRKTIVNGNVVNRMSNICNRMWLELLKDTLDELKLTSRYDLMLDASAGDLWTGKGYRFALTDGCLRSSSDMCNFWSDLIDEFSIRFLEDPFHERDFESWKQLTHDQKHCQVIGDNLYSSDLLRIREGAERAHTHGAIVKPDQAGTVSSAIDAVETAQRKNQTVITSHRSISTESVFISTLTNRYDVKYIKIGPLATDYSAIARLNELIRLGGIGYE